MTSEESNDIWNTIGVTQRDGLYFDKNGKEIPFKVANWLWQEEAHRRKVEQKEFEADNRLWREEFEADNRLWQKEADKREAEREEEEKEKENNQTIIPPKSATSFTGRIPQELKPLLLDDDEHEEVSKEVDTHIDDLIEPMPKQDQRLAQMVGEIDKKNQTAIAEFGAKSAELLAEIYSSRRKVALK
jgi:hypothetical protein